MITGWVVGLDCGCRKIGMAAAGTAEGTGFFCIGKFYAAVYTVHSSFLLIALNGDGKLQLLENSVNMALQIRLPDIADKIQIKVVSPG